MLRQPRMIQYCGPTELKSEAKIELTKAYIAIFELLIWEASQESGVIHL